MGIASPMTLAPSGVAYDTQLTAMAALPDRQTDSPGWGLITSQKGPAIEYQRLELCRTYGPRHGNLNLHAWLSAGPAKTLLAAVRAPRHPGAAAHLCDNSSASAFVELIPEHALTRYLTERVP